MSSSLLVGVGVVVLSPQNDLCSIVRFNHPELKTSFDTCINDLFNACSSFTMLEKWNECKLNDDHSKITQFGLECAPTMTI